MWLQRPWFPLGLGCAKLVLHCSGLRLFRCPWTRCQIQVRRGIETNWVWPEIRICRGHPPLLQTFVAGPLFQNLVAGSCVEYCSLQSACRREGLSQDSPILLARSLVAKRAARACCTRMVWGRYEVVSMAVVATNPHAHDFLKRWPGVPDSFVDGFCCPQPRCNRFSTLVQLRLGHSRMKLS